MMSLRVHIVNFDWTQTQEHHSHDSSIYKGQPIRSKFAYRAVDLKMKGAIKKKKKELLRRMSLVSPLFQIGQLFVGVCRKCK